MQSHTRRSPRNSKNSWFAAIAAVCLAASAYCLAADAGDEAKKEETKQKEWWEAEDGAESKPGPGTYAVFSTSKGSFTAKIFVDRTPITAQNFIGLVDGTKAWRDAKTGEMVKKPLYKNRKIFRVVKGFMFQTGSGDDTNTFRSGFTIPDEILPDLNFTKPGLLAMANIGRPNSGSCQFFVTTGTPGSLNGKYTIFGEVVAGMDTVYKIDAVPVKRSSSGERSEPLDMPVIHTIDIQRVE